MLTAMTALSGLPSAASQHGEQVGLPAVVEELLVEVVDDGFTLYCCGPKAAPRALVACYEWDHYVDLLTIRDFDRVITARAPKWGAGDIFAPKIVVWAYQGPPQHALRALLNLMHPAHPDAPIAEYPAPAGLRVPRVQQRPMTIQLPLPSRAGARATRLAAEQLCLFGHRIPGWSPVEPAAPDARLLAAGRSPTAGLLSTGRERRGLDQSLS